MFTVVAITLPDFAEGEADMIVRALGSGAVDRVHLRKPGCELRQMARLIALSLIHISEPTRPY